MPKAVSIMFVIVPVLMAVIIGFTIVMMFSPKLRGKMMARQVRSMRHMVDFAEEDLTHMGVKAGDIATNIQEEILDRNEDRMRSNATRMAHVSSDAVRETMRAVKEGLGDDMRDSYRSSYSANTVYCKHCGARIDADSRFCKSCGKEQ